MALERTSRVMPRHDFERTVFDSPKNNPLEDFIKSIFELLGKIFSIFGKSKKSEFRGLKGKNYNVSVHNVPDYAAKTKTVVKARVLATTNAPKAKTPQVRKTKAKKTTPHREEISGPFNRDNIFDYLTTPEREILENIQTIINRLKTTTDRQRIVRLSKALDAQLNGIKRPKIQDQLCTWCIQELISVATE